MMKQYILSTFVDSTINLAIPSGERARIIDDVSRNITVHITAHKDATVTYEYVAQPRDEKVSRTVIATCKEEGSHISLQCRMHTIGKQQITLHTTQIHEAPHTTSESVIRGVSLDKSRVTVDTMIRIVEGAQHVDAQQEHKHLLLSSGARATSDPKIEVSANDVSCGHGAAIRYIDEEYLFYLMSRGLSLEHAQQQIVDGFLRL